MAAISTSDEFFDHTRYMYQSDDFLKGTEFDSLEQLNERLKLSLDHTPEVANQRLHGTTRLVPNQQWLSEKQFLIQLPEKRFPVYDQSIRVVDDDATLSIGGTRYTVPSSLPLISY